MPKIYVACLAAYNNGILHGEWINAAQESDDILEDIQNMLKKSPEPDAEEWAIHDYEGFNGIKIGEYEDIEKLAALAKAIEQHGEAFAKYYAYDPGKDIESLIDQFEEAYQGCFSREKEFAEQLFDDLYLHEVPEHLRFYIDYEAFERDLFCGDYWSADGDEGCHVFRSL